MTIEVLVPMDGSPMAKRALVHALSTHPDAEITVLYVVDDIEERYGTRALVGIETLRERARERAEQLFERAESTAADHDADVATEIRVGDPAREIVGYAADHDVDLVVIGSHGRSPRASCRTEPQQHH
ncbi:MAG: universal stress protein [Halobacteriales archaeon]